MRRNRLLIAIALVFATLRCAAAGTIRADRNPQLYLSLANQAKYSSIGLINQHTSAGNYFSSGALVAPNWVLTAAHVVDRTGDLKFTVGGASYDVLNWVTNPNWSGDLISGNDLALLRLSAPVLGTAPAIRYTGAADIGVLGTIVGYGRTGTGATGATVYDPRRRAGTNTIDGTLRTPIANAKILVADFDNPTKPTDSTLGSKIPTDLEFMIAGGDSGGGLFIDTTVGTRLAGISSFGAAPDGRIDSDYGDTMGFTRLAMFNDWIDSVLRGATSGPGFLLGSATKSKLFASAGASMVAADVPEPAGFGLALAGGLAALYAAGKRGRLTRTPAR